MGAHEHAAIQTPQASPKHHGHAPGDLGEKIFVPLARQYDVQTRQISFSRALFLEGASGLVNKGVRNRSEGVAGHVKTPHAKIGEWTLERFFYPLRSGMPLYRIARIDDQSRGLFFHPQMDQSFGFEPEQPLVPRSSK